MKGFKDVIILVLIATFAGIALSGVYLGTKERIELAKQRELQDALSKVCPFLEGEYEEVLFNHEGTDIQLYVVRKDGKHAGAGIKMITSEGFSGNITFLMGVDAEHRMTGLYILEHKETPGLGTKAAEKEWWGQMMGKGLDNFTFRVTKDKGDVDAITAATITSRAVTHAVGRGLAVCRAYLDQQLPVDEVIEPESDSDEAVAAEPVAADEQEVNDGR